jgi:hypothetical protein
MTRQFSPAERQLVHRAMFEAEEHTTRYYCFPPHRWQDLRFDLLTRKDRDWQPVPDSVLAKLLRLHKVSPRPNHSYDFYRIQLNDPSILGVSRRQDFGADLYPFLVYILTHEMVHLVRLSSILEEDPLILGSPDAEESKVDRISRQILCAAPHLQIDPIISKFRLRHCTPA